MAFDYRNAGPVGAAIATPARHTHGPNFGRTVQGCPRCAELAAGAAPIAWNQGRGREAARLAEIRAHDCARSGCGIVCTAFEW